MRVFHIRPGQMGDVLYLSSADKSLALACVQACREVRKHRQSKVAYTSRRGLCYNSRTKSCSKQTVHVVICSSGSLDNTEMNDHRFL